MQEIRIHGRGGQGSKKAAQVLARAAYLSGYKTQDFAMYGAERKGAPLTSFVRFSKEPIGTRGVIFNPDFIIIIDETLDMEKTLEGKKPDTIILVNSHKPVSGQHAIDATSIVLEELGKPIPNIAMLGALLKFLKEVPMENLEKAIEIEFSEYSKDIIDKNIKAAKRCFELAK